MAEYGINIDYLQNTIKSEEKNEKNASKKSEKYSSKLVEYNFFIQNELEISKKINEHDVNINYDGSHRFLIIQKHDFIKICEANSQLLEKMNIQLDNHKKLILLKYIKEIETMKPFIDAFFCHSFINNNPSHIFWDLIRINEDLFDDLLYLQQKNIYFLDLSCKNLVFNGEFSIYFTNFEKCFIKKNFNILNNEFNTSRNELLELQNYYVSSNNLQTITKYVEIEKYVDKFIQIMQNVDYFGNKHFDLYFSKQLIKHRNFHIVFQNLDVIIDSYLNELYFLQFFSDKFKKDIKLKWKIQIKTNIEQNMSFLNISTEKVSWKLYLCLLLERKTDLTWEIFSLNSLFINVTYYILKIFDIQDKTSVVHRYFKYLFTNMDINSCSFCNNNNQVNIKKCMNNYNKFRDTFEKLKDFNDFLGFYCLSHVTTEMQEELYDFLLKNIEYF
jgi:hypothetical protein